MVIEHEDPETIRINYTADNIPVKVKIGKESHQIEVDTILRYIDSIPTSDKPLHKGGEVLQNGTKRVYATIYGT